LEIQDEEYAEVQEI